MSIVSTLIGAKLAWKAMEARAAALPAPYRSTYDHIKTYAWKTASGDGRATVRGLDTILAELEAGAARGAGVGEVTGPDVAAYCDARLHAAGAASYVDRWRAELNAAATSR